MAAGDAKSTLRDLWTRARRDGTLSPWQQACAFGLKEAWEEMHGDKRYGKAKWIAERVHVQGRGTKRPCPEAITMMMSKMTEDEDWFPGKVYGSLGGRPPALSETNKSVIAASAMAMKKRGIDPTYPLIVAQCPNASRNPLKHQPGGEPRGPHFL